VINNLSVLAYADEFTLWHYRGRDSETLRDIGVPGYFGNAVFVVARGLRFGDIVLVSACDGAAILTVASTTSPVTVCEVGGIIDDMVRRASLARMAQSARRAKGLSRHLENALASLGRAVANAEPAT
jgi:hypothetical protein